MWLFGILQYFRYYLHGRPVLDSDFGDFHHPFHFPYCRIIVVERALAQELRHIKSMGLALQDTEVHDVSFVREQTFNEW